MKNWLISGPFAGFVVEKVPDSGIVSVQLVGSRVLNHLTSDDIE